MARGKEAAIRPETRVCNFYPCTEEAQSEARTISVMHAEEYQTANVRYVRIYPHKPTKHTAEANHYVLASFDTRDGTAAISWEEGNTKSPADACEYANRLRAAALWVEQQTQPPASKPALQLVTKLKALRK